MTILEEVMSFDAEYGRNKKPKGTSILDEVIQFGEEYDAQQPDFSWMPKTAKRPEPKKEEPGYGEVIGKGVMRGFEGLAGGVGSITRWAGEAAGIKPLARVGKEASEYWKSAQQEGVFAGDKGLYRGTFMENPSFKRAAGIISEAIPSLGAGLVTGGAGMAAGLSRTAASWLAGSSLALLEGAPQYGEAREAGKSVGEASVVGLASTAGTAILESLAIGKFLRLGKKGATVAAKKTGRLPSVKDAGKGMVIEGGQEVSQQIWQNLVAKMGYDATQDLAEGLVEAFIGGAGAGGIAGGVTSKLNRVADKAKESGVTDEEIDEAVEDLTGQINEKAQSEILNTAQQGLASGELTHADIADLGDQNPELKSTLNEITAEHARKQVEARLKSRAHPPEMIVGEATQAGALDDNETLKQFDMSQYGVQDYNLTGPLPEQAKWRPGTVVEQPPMDRLKVKLAGRKIGMDAKFTPETGESAVDAGQVFEDLAGKEDQVRQSPAGAEGLKKQLEGEEKWSFSYGNLEGRAPYFERYLQDLKEGTPGGRVKTEDLDGTEQWQGYSSTYPEWFKNQGWSADKAIKAIERGLAGTPHPESERGQGQESIWQAAWDAAKEERNRDILDMAQLIEENPKNVKNLNDDEYRLMLEVLEDEGFYSGQITEVAAEFRGTVQGKAVEEIGAEQGISKEEIEAILNDPNEPDVTLENVWAEIRDEDRAWVDEQDRAGLPTIDEVEISGELKSPTIDEKEKRIPEKPEATLPEGYTFKQGKRLVEGKWSAVDAEGNMVGNWVDSKEQVAGEVDKVQKTARDAGEKQIALDAALQAVQSGAETENDIKTLTDGRNLVPTKNAIGILQSIDPTLKAKQAKAIVEKSGIYGESGGGAMLRSVPAVVEQWRKGQEQPGQPDAGNTATGTSLFKPVLPDKFVEERNKTKRPEFLTPYQSEDMKGWQTFLTDDGVGYSLTGKKDIIGIFNNSGRRGAGREAVVEAIKKGGKSLDCIDGYLDDYYNDFGFQLKERVQWDDQEAPKGWNYEKYGRPTISFWEYPESISRKPADIRRRFQAARSKRAAVSGYAGVEGVRSNQHGKHPKASQPGMDQTEQGSPDRRTGTNLRDVAPAEKAKPETKLSRQTDPFAEIPEATMTASIAKAHNIPSDSLKFLNTWDMPEIGKKLYLFNATGLSKDHPKFGSTLAFDPSKSETFYVKGDEAGMLHPVRTDSKALEQLRKDVHGWLKDVMPRSVLKRLTVELAPHISKEGKDVAASDKQWAEIEGKPGEIMGAATTDKLRAFIELSYNFDNKTIQKNTYHESFHVAARWLLPDADYKTVMDHFKGNEEAAANAFMDFAMRTKGRKVQPSFIYKVFRNLRAIFKRIRKGLTGQGFKAPEDVFRKLWGKEYGLLPAETISERVDAGKTGLSKSPNPAKGKSMTQNKGPGEIPTNQASVSPEGGERLTPSIEAITKALEKRGVKGDPLLDAKDLVEDLLEKNGQIDKNGMVALFHRTSLENAKKIVQSQAMVGKEDQLFFGTHPEGQIDGYGEAVVKVSLPIENLELNDVFPGEAHVTLKSGKPGKINKIPAELWKPSLPNQSRPSSKKDASVSPEGGKKITVYHTSPDVITEIKDDYGSGVFGDVLFFSDDEYVMTAKPDYHVYSMVLDPDSLLKVKRLFYEYDPSEVPLLQEEINHVKEYFEIEDDELAQNLIDETTDIAEVEDDLGYVGDGAWFIQKKQAEIAKILGYKGAVSVDEQGAVYAIPMKGKEQDLKLEKSIENGKTILPNQSRPSSKEGQTPTQFSRAVVEKAEKDLKEDTISVFKLIPQIIKNRKKGWRPHQKKDLTGIDRALSTPLMAFQKIPAMWRLFNAAVNRTDVKNTLVNEMTQNADGLSYTKLLNTFKRKNKIEYRKLKKYLKKRDQHKTGYGVVEDGDNFILKSLKGKKVGAFDSSEEAWRQARIIEAKDYQKEGASEGAIKALLAVRAISDNGFNLLMGNMRDLIQSYEERGIELPSEVVTTEGKKIEINLKHALAEMGEIRGYYMPRSRTSGQYHGFAKKKGVNPVFKKFDTKIMLNTWHANMERKGYKVSKDISHKMPEDVFAMMASTMATQQILNQALENIDTKGLSLEDFGFEIVDRKGGPGHRDFIVKGTTSKDMREVFKKMGGQFYPSDPGGAKVWHFPNPGQNFNQRLAKALMNVADLVDIQSQALFVKAMTEQFADVIKGRGARMHMINRTDAKGVDVWEGYEEDPAIAMARYAQGLAAGEAKKLSSLEMIKAFTGTDISWDHYKATNEKPKYEGYLAFCKHRGIEAQHQPHAFKEGTSYIQNMLRNEEAMDRIMGTIKGAAVLKYLAGRVSAPLVNLTALATSVPAAMNGVADIPLHKAPVHLAKAMQYYKTYRFGDKNSMPKDVRMIFDEIHQKGWHSAQYNREAFAALKGKVGTGWDNMIEWTMMGFGVTETINRVATIAGTALGIRAKGNFDLTAALEKAKEVSDKAHSVYNKANHPGFVRGGDVGRQIARSFYMFRTFSHQYLLMMKELWGNSWKPSHGKAFAYMAISPAILAGGGAFLGTPLIAAIAKAFTNSDDPEEDWYKWLDKNVGYYAENMARMGVFGLAGVNLKGSLDLGITDIPTNIKDVLGAPGSMVSDFFYYGPKDILFGDTSKGVEKMLPNFMAAPFKAYREHTEGITTRSNTPIFYGKDPVKADLTDAILRAISFNPVGISEIRERLWNERKIEQAYRDRRNVLGKKLKRLYLHPEKITKADWANYLTDVREYNARVIAHGKVGIIPIVDWKWIKNTLRRAFTPSKKELRKRAAM